MDVVEGQCCCHGLMAAAAATVWPSAGVSEGAEAVLRVVRELSEEYQRTLYLNEDAQGGQREVGSQGGTPNTRQACRQAGRQQAVMAGDGWWVGGLGTPPYRCSKATSCCCWPLTCSSSSHRWERGREGTQEAGWLADGLWPAVVA